MTLAPLIAALSRALDLTEARPTGHAVRSAWVALRVGREMGLAPRALGDLFYAVLLKDLGLRELRSALVSASARPISTGGGLAAADGRDSILFEVVGARSACAASIAQRLRFGEGVAAAIALLHARWDGLGFPRGIGGEDLPVAARIGLVAESVDLLHGSCGRDVALREVWLRGGRWFDPAVVDALFAAASDASLWDGLVAPDLAERLFASEPARFPVPVDDDYLDDITEAIGAVVDARSSFTGQHSARVATITDLLARDLGMPAARRRWLRRGATLHDLGKLAVPNAVLEKPGRLDPDERRQVERHACFTEEILGMIPAFGELAAVAGAHHERLDGGGYPRGSTAEEITLETRLISVADVFDALSAERPYRAAMDLDRVLGIMRGDVGAAFDARAFEALATRVRRASHASEILEDRLSARASRLRSAAPAA